MSDMRVTDVKGSMLINSLMLAFLVAVLTLIVVWAILGQFLSTPTVTP